MKSDFRQRWSFSSISKLLKVLFLYPHRSSFISSVNNLLENLLLGLCCLRRCQEDLSLVFRWEVEIVVQIACGFQYLLGKVRSHINVNTITEERILLSAFLCRTNCSMQLPSETLFFTITIISKHKQTKNNQRKIQTKQTPQKMPTKTACEKAICIFLYHLLYF